MEGRRKALAVDGAVNLILGVPLIWFPRSVVDFLGIPWTGQAFYPSILGAVLVGIAIALFLECAREPDGAVGLGLVGAVAVNLCGAVVLGVWLVAGNLGLALRGQAFLWGLVVVLVGVSSVEIFLRK